MKEFFNWKGFTTGFVSSVIASGFIWLITKKLPWNILLPLWIWLSVTLLVFLLIYLICFIVRRVKIIRAISEYKEGVFGDSYEYIWEYKRSKGVYSVYGYEPYNIRTKRSLSELNNEHTITIGHEVPESTIKMFIQLTLISRIDKKTGEKLMPMMNYLNWIETKNKQQF